MTSQETIALLRRELISFMDELISQFAASEWYAEFIAFRLYADTKLDVRAAVDRFLATMTAELLSEWNTGLIERDVVRATNIIKEFTIPDYPVSPDWIHKRVLAFWNSSSLDDEEREVIWEWIDRFALRIRQYTDLVQTEREIASVADKLKND